MTEEEKIKLASQIAINFGIDCTDAKCRVEQAFMNFGEEFSMSTETSDKNVATEEDIKVIKNIEKLRRIEFKHCVTDREIKAMQNILAELERKDKRIQELEEELENSIPKQAVIEALEDIEDYFDKLNGPDEDIEYIRHVKQEILEGESK